MGRDFETESTMRARLLIVNPDKNKTPRIPTLILEDGVIGIYQEDRGWPLAVDSLENVTREDLEKVWHIRPSDRVIISEIRTLPDFYLMSPEAIQYCHAWWRETVGAYQK